MKNSTRTGMNVNGWFKENQIMRATRFIVLTFWSVFLGMNSFAQTYTDNASNYGGSWTNGSNNSSPTGGFGNWSITAGASSGVFIGNPSTDGMGTSGIGTTAFAMYATGGAYCNASRGISGGMQVGDVLTFYWAMNFDAGAGSKGFDLKSSGTTIFNVNNTGSATITTTNGTAFTAYGTAPMLVTVTRTSSSSYSFNMTARNGGAAYSTTINSSSSIDGLNFYIGNQNDGAGQKNIYLNAFSLAKPNQYRSAASGNWGTAATWEISTDGGSNWSAAGAAPGSTLYSTITIRNTHTVSQNQNYSGGSNNNIVIESGGVLNMTGATGTFQFNTLSVSGTVSRNNASHVYSGSITINNGGKYVHAVNGGSVPTCTWSSGSTFEVTGVTSAVDFTSGSVQNYHHIVWNCTGQSSIFSFGGLTTINGNFTVQSTGSSPSSTSCLFLTNSTAITTTIGGNLTVSGGFFAPFGASTANSSTLNISGNLSISGGTFDIYRPASNTGTINLAGDFSMSGGTLTKGGAGTGNFNFSKSGTQTYSKSSGTISGAINFTVNSGSTLSMGTNVLDGSTGTFTLSSGGGLETGNTAGITTTGATGSIQVGGSRTYNTGGNYSFNGSSAQNTGSGLPATISSLTVNNTAGVTLSANTTVTGTLTLTAGSLNLGGYTLTLNSGSSAQSITGAGSNIFNISNGIISLTGSGAHAITLSNFGTTASGGLILGSNVTLQLNSNAALNCGGNGSTTSMLTVLGTMQMNSGTSSNIDGGKPPFYGDASTLEYKVSYNRFDEWKNTSGPGYPNHVTLTGSITLNVVNGVNSYKKAAGNLTVGASATFSMPDITSGTNGVGVEFLGNIINDGTISLNTGSNTTSQRLKAANLTNGSGNATASINLSGATGGDLELTGNYTDNANFTANQRAVFFTGSGTQTVGGTASAPFNIDYIVSNKTSGIIQLNSSLLVGGPNGGNAITLTDGDDILALNGNALTIGTNAQTAALSGTGLIRGSSSSSIIINGTGSLGTISFDATSGGRELNSLTINRTSTGSVTLGSDLTVNALTLTAGNLILGSNTLTTTTISAGGASSYIRTNSTGSLKQNITNAGGSKTFPVGNSAYNPVTITNNSGSADDFTVNVADAVTPSVSNGKVDRTWNIGKGSANSGGTGINFTFNWNGGEVSGSLTDARLFHYSGSTWNQQSGTTSVSGNSLTYTGYTGGFSPFYIGEKITVTPVTFTSLTGSIRNGQARLTWNVAQEINVDRYEVEESVNGREFQSLTQVDAASRSSYQTIDAQLALGANYYRVKSVDIDGKLTYSKTIRLENSTLASDIRLYPNPSQGELNLGLNIPAGNYQIRVINAVGQTVFQQPLTHEGGSRSLPLSLPKLNAGIYQVEVRGGLEKFVKSLRID